MTETGLAIFLGNGNGTFAAPKITPLSSNGGWMVVADFNGDKIPDLLTGTDWLLGNGDGTFQAPVSYVGADVTNPPPYPLDYFSPSLAVDLTGNGKVDVVGPFPLGVVSYLNISEPAPAVTVVSSASFAFGPVAPESLATGFGKNLALSTATAPGGQPFPTTMGNTTLSVQDASGVTRSAELLYVSPEQVNFVVPSGTSSGTATVTVTVQQTLLSSLVQTGTVQIAPVAPGMFALNTSDLAAAYVTLVSAGQQQTYESVFTLQNGTPVATPVSLGPSGSQAYLTLYGTGLRNAGAGAITVDIQGLNAPVASAGPVTGIHGLDQVTVSLPGALAGSGDVSIVVTAAGIAANTVQITIQ